MPLIPDTVIGLYHFMFDRVPKGLTLVPPRPRQPNPWVEDGVPLVARVKPDSDLKSSVARLLGSLGGVGKAIKSGDRVLIKPNFNSPDLPPGSTDLEFLQAIIEILREHGARVSVGECSGGLWRPTRNTVRKLKVPELLARLGVEMIIFDDRPRDWVRVNVGGDYLKTVIVPRAAYEADKLVYLPCLKTHRIGRFSMSLKLSVGFMHPGERRSLHQSHLEEKAAEINLAWQPYLTVMDGRKAFISGGPDKGELAHPGILMASGDMVAIDIEGLKVLGGYRAQNKLTSNPEGSPQIAVALKHALGKKDYRLVGDKV